VSSMLTVMLGGFVKHHDDRAKVRAYIDSIPQVVSVRDFNVVSEKRGVDLLH
jgi:hypothetical protein